MEVYHSSRVHLSVIQLLHAIYERRQGLRTMNQPGKLECITREASRLKLDVLGLSEVRWKNAGRCTSNEHVMIYSGHMT